MNLLFIIKLFEAIIHEIYKIRNLVINIFFDLRVHYNIMHAFSCFYAYNTVNSVDICCCWSAMDVVEI